MMDLTVLSATGRRRNRRKPAGGRTFDTLLAVPACAWRRFVPITGFVLLAAVTGYVLVLLLDRPVHKVDIAGPFQRVTPAQVEQAVTVVLKSGAKHAGFLSADLGAVRRSVESLAWVDRARVERSWPGRLRVQIIEQTPAARWGESGLLNTRGELFIGHARHIPAELPRLEGPEGSEWQVAQLYLGTQGRLLEAGMRLDSLTLDARGALELTLVNGVQVRCGRRQVQARLERFVRDALPVLAARAAEVSYVDMRYSNGFAIGWKNA